VEVHGESTAAHLSDSRTLEQMRSEWNQRAREDAKYYVAFGRRGQDDDEFFASASDVVRSLDAELKRLAPGGREARRGLEIGCGPGRLLRPMSRRFSELHGTDVSDEMIRLARENLASVRNVRVHRCADLSAFPDDYFDFVYSYAVFQHIPSRAVVFGYLEESRRVLKDGGILRCQINGLPETAARYTTWEGVRISAAEAAAFAREHDFQVLHLEGAGTQYMWTTWRKRVSGWRRSLRSEPVRDGTIRGVASAQTGEAVVPATGPFAAAALRIERFPADCDITDLEIHIDALRAQPLYIGPPAWDDLTQINVAMPPGVRTGLVPVEVSWLGAPLCPPAWVRIIPPGPAVPRVCSVTDGVNLLSGTIVSSRIVKVTVEEFSNPERFGAVIAGYPAGQADLFCIDPVTQRYEINLPLPSPVVPGRHRLEMTLGNRIFAPVDIEVV
jgi:SAM-dependent methyltransferase